MGREVLEHGVNREGRAAESASYGFRSSPFRFLLRFEAKDCNDTHQIDNAAKKLHGIALERKCGTVKRGICVLNRFKATLLTSFSARFLTESNFLKLFLMHSASARLQKCSWVILMSSVKTLFFIVNIFIVVY